MPVSPETLERQMAPRVIPLHTNDEAIAADARLWNQRQAEMQAADHPLTLAEPEPEPEPIPELPTRQIVLAVLIWMAVLAVVSMAVPAWHWIGQLMERL